MRIKFTLLVAIFILNYSYSQDWLLGTSSNFTNEAFDAKLDAQGNTVSTGYISGHTNFKDSFLISNNGNSDVFITKINSEGLILWNKRFGGSQPDKGLKLAIDSQDNIIVTGSFFGNINFENYNLQSANNSKDIFLVKLNPNGQVLWARKEGGNQGENAYDVTIDSQNNIILTGQFEGNSTIGSNNFSSQINSITNAFSFDIFLAKYDSNGNPIWSKQANSDYEDRGMAVTCDNQNNIYLTGQFSDTLNFFGTLIENQIYNAAFISKINSNGTVQYFKKFAGAMVLPYDIELNSSNEIILTGDFLGNLIYFDGDLITSLTNSYIRKIFILKLSNNGHYIWGKAQGSNSDLSSRTLTIDANQDIYIGGYFNCIFDQYRDSSNTSGLWYSVGFKDVFVSKFNTNGSMIWNKQNGGKKEDICYALDINQNDKPIYAGSFENNFIIPTQSLNLFHYDTMSVDQYHTTWPSPNGNPNSNFKYYLLVGDDSKNSFVGKVIDQSDPKYYYFKGNLTTKPFISPDLNPNLALFNTCIKDSLYFNTKSDNQIGPDYDLLWNGLTDPDKNYYWNLTQDGPITLTATRVDNCSSFKDSITIILHDQFPVSLTDDKGFNNFTFPRYDTIYLCYPDTAIVTPANLCVNCSFEVRYPDTNTLYHSGMTPFTVRSGLRYFIRVYNEYGCVKQDTLIVKRYNNQPYDLIDSDLVLYDTLDFNDSLRICQGDTVLFFATDLNVNPDRNYDTTYFEEFANEYFLETNFNEPIYKWPAWKPYYGRYHWAYFMPDSTGWYKITYNYDLGYANYCRVDITPQTYIDSFYIEVIPNPDPEVIISQDDIICPGEISNIKVEPSIFNFTWSGPSITWQSNDADSIQVSTGGTYLYSGFLENINNSCRFYKEFEVEVLEKSPPYLFRNPYDGIICPNGDVDIWIQEDGNYQWYGVNGTILGTDSLLNVENQGFYYCIFTDPEGCAMLTQQVEIREYTSPSINVYPDAIMCQGESVILNSISFGVSSVHWQSPLNSNLSSITVNQPGTYVCEVNQCGITVFDSVTLIDGSFNLNLSSSQTNLCYGDTATLSVDAGFQFYFWNDLFYDDDSLEVTSAGDYYVSVTNLLGCTQSSNSVSLFQYPESILPPIADTNVCPGASITLTHNSQFQLTWYEDPLGQIPIVTDLSISFTNVMADTFVYAAYASNNCPLAVGNVMINVIEPLLPPPLIGDSTICIGDSLYFETTINDSLSYEWYLNGSIFSNFYSTNNQDSIAIYLDSNAVISLVITDFCSTNSDSATIEIIPKKTISLNLDTELLCPQDPLLLYSVPNFPNGVLWVLGLKTSLSDSLLLYLNQLGPDFIVAYGIDEYGCFSIPDTAHFIIPNLTYLNIVEDGLDCSSYEIELIVESDVSTIDWTLPNQTPYFNQTIFIDSMSDSYTGSYILHAVDQEFGCEMRDTLVLLNHPLPTFEVGEDTSLCYFYSLTYQAPNLPFEFYWNGKKDSSYTTNQTETIEVIAINEFGCSFTDKFNVNFSDCVPNDPNVFTPNGDGINDYLIIQDAELLFDNCILIVNRWGNVVYEENYYQNGFHGYTNSGANKGEKLNDGVYFYLFYSNCNTKNTPSYQGYLHILGSK